MRPSARLFTIAILLTLLSIVMVVWVPNAGTSVTVLWVALGAVCFIDLLRTQPGRRLRISLEAPDHLFAGDQANLTITIDPMPVGIDLRLDMSPELGVALTPPQDTQLQGQFWVNARGRFEIRNLWALWPSSMGLFDVVHKRKLDHMVSGMPNVQPVLSGQITTQVQSMLYGVKDTQFRGEGSEFHQLGDFVAGMDPRSIDWKRSARHNSLLARETHAERNHQIILCVDNGFLMREKLGNLPKIDRAINAALATAWAAGLGGDLVGFYTFDSQPRVYLPPVPGRMAFGNIRAKAAELEYASVESNHTLALAHLNGQLNRRSLVVVFSDFADSTTAELMVENLAVLNRHHVLIYVSLRNPEIDDILNPAEATRQSISMAVSAGQIQKEREIVLDQLRRLGIVCLDVAPENLTPELVSTYLDIKARELI